MSKHTPGPWFIWKEKAYQNEGMDKKEVEVELLELCREHDVMAYQAGKANPEIQRGYARGCRILFTLNVDDHNDDKEECLANARLACAAPELFEALMVMLVAYDDGVGREDESGINWEFPIWQKAKAAIAKATGGDV